MVGYLLGSPRAGWAQTLVTGLGVRFYTAVAGGG